jgi:rod shape-determining protein MreC
MQNLLDFIARNFHWLLFLLLEVASGVMLFGYNSYQGSVWVSTANAVTGKVLEWQTGVEQFFTLTRVNEELSSRNVVLEQQLRIYRDFIRTNALDSAAVSIEDSLGLVAAKVVANTTDRRDNLLTIDRGRVDGVEPDMGVVSGSGLVGVVFTVSDHYSIVLPVLNVHSRISCSIRGREYFGYLTWQGGSPIEAWVEDIPRHAKFNKGDWVETSGYSSIFPKGIAVGRIIAIYNSTDGLSYSLKVHLSTDFSCLRDVFVVTDRSFIEQRQLMEQARDSLDTNNRKF